MFESGREPSGGVWVFVGILFFVTKGKKAPLRGKVKPQSKKVDQALQEDQDVG